MNINQTHTSGKRPKALGIKKDLRKSVRERLEFIEFRLFWEGQVNRRDLIKKFAISAPQAAADISRYRGVADQNLRYDTTGKRYVVTEAFEPLFHNPSSDQYLRQLRLLADDALTSQEHWLGSVPPFDIVPVVRRKLTPSKLRKILDAIRQRQSLRIRYQSFSTPEPGWRRITPHAVVFDGFRWHARAWCHKRGEFADFVMARILTSGEEKPHSINALADVEWHSHVTLRIGADPRLEAHQQRAIELDYGMTDGFAELPTRIALAYYVERRLGLDLNPDCVSAERKQIVLLNSEEIEEARRQAREKTKELLGQVEGRTS